MSDRPLSTIRPISRVGVREDDSGSGRYRASRLAADQKTRYAHEGIDLTAPAGDPVVSPFDGVVDIRDAYTDPTKKEYKIVSVTSGEQRYRFFYVSPENYDGNAFVRDGDRITAGQQIGIVQDIAKSDDKKQMRNHVHFAISAEADKNKKPIYIDPTPQVGAWMSN
jgi:murein DD-endopeptidase MepM/ murein hydrolase activator NlpD